MVFVYILIGLAALMVVFVAIVAMQPASFRIVRLAAMAAPPATVFTHVNDFHNWEAWSPWAKIDPACKITYNGPSAGTGAIFTWSGNNKVGEGKMTITESAPSDLIRIRLEFLRPFKATNLTVFTFKPDGNQTMVEWSMSGQNNFLSKAFCLLFMNMDKCVGGDFEKGLAAMKAVVDPAKP